MRDDAALGVLDLSRISGTVRERESGKRCLMDSDSALLAGHSAVFVERLRFSRTAKPSNAAKRWYKDRHQPDSVHRQRLCSAGS